MVRLGVLGIDGRMGRELQALLASEEFRERFSLARAPKRGEDLSTLFSDIDVLVDFSFADAIDELIRLHSGGLDPKRSIGWLIGTTGLGADRQRRLAAVARERPILQTGNFGVGVLLFSRVLEFVRSRSERRSYGMSIRETHHIHKKDAPSGTALLLRAALDPSDSEKIEIESIREGEVIGRHEVILENESERLVFTHEAKSRSLFARGALLAAERFVAQRDTLPSRLLALGDLWN